VVRFLHIQNWPEATRFAIDNFRLGSHDNDEEDTSQPGLADWINQKKPQRRAGKPLLLAKSWRVSSDPWRRKATASARNTNVIAEKIAEYRYAEL
jgi:hypothetical protein